MPRTYQSDIDAAVRSQIIAAQAGGLEFVELNAGVLHSKLGLKQRTPMVCNAMRKEFVDGLDQIIVPVESGQGPKLTYRYSLPRPAKNL